MSAVPSRFAVALLLAFFTVSGIAAPTSFQVSVDDFVSLSIGGVSVASNDAFPWGMTTGSVDLPAGWYPISLRGHTQYQLLIRPREVLSRTEKRGGLD